MSEKTAPVHTNTGTRSASWAKAGLAALVIAGLASCTFTQTSDVSNPLVRKASWFSYLNADDLRQACAAGDAEGQIRIIYNAEYYKEVRVFELTPYPGFEEFNLTTRVFGPIQVKEINVEVNAPLGAFGGEEAVDRIDRDSYLAITDALQAEGFGTQNRDGLRLYSDDFYWVAIGCSSGGITLGTWASGVDDLRALKFPEVLANLSSVEKDLPEPPAAENARSQSAAQMHHVQNSDSGEFYRTVRGNTLR
ncbi:hypothetical protein [Thalassospira profundimaris]|uniref:hypothetical protein n=1 Tax=Thalassospira profundimaris TaxID=502049 RepID=UPI0002874331|nr:hypothetical protein [Thalassospira profundimaris]EKF08113.1 hypothetical protein TH2_11434 [Thalassospira profundimaris WP0211]